MKQAIGIIPARWASSRFPGKPLVQIGGKPMIARVYEQARQALERVVVATDDSRIYDCVRGFGGEAVMTRNDHKCGTERCLEAYEKMKNDPQSPWYNALHGVRDDEIIVVNIQGDEPFIQPEQIRLLCGLFSMHNAQCTMHNEGSEGENMESADGTENDYDRKDKTGKIEDSKPAITDNNASDGDNAREAGVMTEIGTLVKPFRATDRWEALANPNTPKVVFSEADQRALLFSRSVIPYMRGVPQEEWLQKGRYYGHIGMYAYRGDVLRRIVAMPMSRMEQTESLEQLRWLENGVTIRVAVSEQSSIGIDTPEDLEKAKELIRDKTASGTLASLCE